MGRLIISPELLAKAQELMKDGKGLRVNEGLSRKELRALERAGFVEKMKIFSRRKFVDTAPTMSYVYKLKEF